MQHRAWRIQVGLLSLLFVTAFSANSQLPPSKSAPTVGQKLPEFTLPDSSGNPVKVSTLYGGEEKQWMLLVFYRGYW